MLTNEQQSKEKIAQEILEFITKETQKFFDKKTKDFPFWAKIAVKREFSNLYNNETIKELQEEAKELERRILDLELENYDLKQKLDV